MQSVIEHFQFKYTMYVTHLQANVDDGKCTSPVCSTRNNLDENLKRPLLLHWPRYVHNALNIAQCSRCVAQCPKCVA